MDDFETFCASLSADGECIALWRRRKRGVKLWACRLHGRKGTGYGNTAQDAIKDALNLPKDGRREDRRDESIDNQEG